MPWPGLSGPLVLTEGKTQPTHPDTNSAGQSCPFPGAGKRTLFSTSLRSPWQCLNSLQARGSQCCPSSWERTSGYPRSAERCLSAVAMAALVLVERKPSRCTMVRRFSAASQRDHTVPGPQRGDCTGDAGASSRSNTMRGHLHQCFVQRALQRLWPGHPAASGQVTLSLKE